jgi:hypothetical protein
MGPVDTNIVDLFVAQRAISETETNREVILKPSRETALRMGQVPLLDGQPTPDVGCLLVRFGGVTRKKQVLNLSWVGFERVDEGAPALVEWLCDRGCSDIRYVFREGMDFSGD